MKFLTLYVLRTLRTAALKIHLAQKMELSREHFRAIIFHNSRSGLNPQQCIDELNSIFGDDCSIKDQCLLMVWYGSSIQAEFREIRNQFREPLMLCAN